MNRIGRSLYLFVLALSGCTGSSSATKDGACDAIIRACHPLDRGEEGAIHTCHVIGHDLNEAVCSSRKDECLGVCPYDGSMDREPIQDESEGDPCTSYCRCMVSTCSADSENSCMRRCVTLQSRERSCWRRFCAKAETAIGPAKKHDCDHAEGLYGMAECS